MFARKKIYYINTNRTYDYDYDYYYYLKLLINGVIILGPYYVQAIFASVSTSIIRGRGFAS